MKYAVVVTLLLFVLLQSTLCAAQQKFDFYISNSGKDVYPGTSAIFPRKTIGATEPLFKAVALVNDSVKIGLKSGAIFNENLVTSYPIMVSTYSDNPNQDDPAILNGSREYNSGWVKQEGSVYTFGQDIPYSGFSGYGINGIGSYSYIYVTEINRAIEKAAPFTARMPMKFVTSLAALEATPGSFYSPVNTTENPKHIFIHTSNGNSPNANAKYSYEVTVRDWAINSTYQQGNRFENLWVRGFGAGNGILPGGSNSYYNKIIFGPGAGIHHLVVRSGILDHSLFLPGSENTNEFAVVFYDVEGLGRHCTIKNSIFLDIPSPVYAHTSEGTNFGAVEMYNIAGFADTSNVGSFMYTSNTDSVFLNNVYADGYLCGYNYGSAKYSSISNSYFKDVRFGIGYSNKNPVDARVDNVFIKTHGSAYTAGIYMQNNTSLQLTNSIIRINNDYKNYFPNAGAFIIGAGSETGRVRASGNIFICDIFPSASLVAATANTDKGIATSPDIWNNNVYILLKGNKITWTITDAATNTGTRIVQNFDEWKRQSGQDQNSLFFDLRKDPRGLKAIFTDPDNGNYDLADTPEGRQVAALKAGMTTPPSCFLQKPTYETAAEYIKTSKELSVNACRNPCYQNTIRINNTFTVDAVSERKVTLTWNVSEQQNINHYEIERAIGNYIFKKISLLPITGDSLHTYTDNIQPGIIYQYRLAVIANAGGRCYSEVRSIKTNNDKPFIVYPNPSKGKIVVSMNGYIGTVNFTLYNLQGQPIWKKEVINLYAPQQFGITNNPRGLYLLKAETSKGINFQKIILQ